MIGRNVDSLARAIKIRRSVVAELLNWHATAAVPIVPAGHDGSCSVSHIRKDRNFALYHFARSCLCISADSAGRRRALLNLHGKLPRLDLQWLRLRKYERLVLRDCKRPVLRDTKLWIRDTHSDFDGRIATQ